MWPIQREVACSLAAVRIADHNRDDVQRVVEDRQARRAERVLGDGGDVLVLRSSSFQAFRWRIAVHAPAATMGGKVVVKMNCGA